MDFRLSDEQQALRDAVRELLSRESPIQLVRERYADPNATADALWRQVSASGWLGLLVPEAHGGLGLGPVELALVLEEAGRALTPIPLWETAALGAASTEDPELLGSLAAGKVRASAALGDIDVSTADDRLSGRLTAVPEAHAVDVLLIGTEAAVYAVDTADCAVQLHDTLDRTRVLCDVALERTPARRLIPRPGGRQTATVGLAAELVGAARWLLDTTVSYVQVREQFGVPVGSFQAVQHTCADVLLEVEKAAAAVYWAAMCVAAGDREAGRATAVAKATAGDAARLAAKSAVQLHGGIGFTWEHDLHLYVRRVYTAEPLLGGAEEQRAYLAQLLLS